MQMGIIEVFICRRLHMNTSMILICIWLICRLGTTLHTKCCGAVCMYVFTLKKLLTGSVTQKLIRVKIDPAGSLLVAINDPAGSLLAAKSDPPLQKVIRVQILVDSSLF